MVRKFIVIYHNVKEDQRVCKRKACAVPSCGFENIHHKLKPTDIIQQQVLTNNVWQSHKLRLAPASGRTSSAGDEAGERPSFQHCRGTDLPRRCLPKCCIVRLARSPRRRRRPLTPSRATSATCRPRQMALLLCKTHPCRQTSAPRTQSAPSTLILTSTEPYYVF
jgi:hypothetical protein